MIERLTALGRSEENHLIFASHVKQPLTRVVRLVMRGASSYAESGLGVKDFASANQEKSAAVLLRDTRRPRQVSGNDRSPGVSQLHFASKVLLKKGKFSMSKL